MRLEFTQLVYGITRHGVYLGILRAHGSRMRSRALIVKWCPPWAKFLNSDWVAAHLPRRDIALIVWEPK